MIQGMIEGHVQAALAQQEQQRNNSPSFGESRHRFVTTGSGLIVPQTAITFTTAFQDEPFFTFGTRVVPPAGQAPAAGAEMPMCVALVWDYVLDDRNLYVGAKMAYRIETLATAPHIGLSWSLHFTGGAIKAIPAIDQAYAAKPL